MRDKMITLLLISGAIGLMYGLYLFFSSQPPQSDFITMDFSAIGRRVGLIISSISALLLICGFIMSSKIKDNSED